MNANARKVTQIDIGGGLRSVLKARDMSIVAFAKAVGVSDKNIHEQLARNGLALLTLNRWATALDMLPSELLREMELAWVKKQVASSQVAPHNASTPHNNGSE